MYSKGTDVYKKVTVLMSSKDGAEHTPGPSTSYDAKPRSILTFSPVSSSSSPSFCSSVLGEETAHFPKIFRKTDEEMFLRRPGTMFQQTKLRPKKEENPPEPSTKIKEDENGILQLTKKILNSYQNFQSILKIHIVSSRILRSIFYKVCYAKIVILHQIV